MGIVKIRLNTWARKKNRDVKFKRGIAPREGYIDYDQNTKTFFLKNGDTKWKPWDITVSRKDDQSYIERKKFLYEGLFFESKSQARVFIEKHQELLNELAKTNPLFSNWSIMNVIKRFEPTKKIIYLKDTVE